MFERDYHILRVERDADPETLRKAFVKLSRRYPPEHFPEKFKRIKNAYDRLTLNYSSIKSLVKELATHHLPEDMTSFLYEQAFEQEAALSQVQVPEMDVMSLEPIFARSQHQSSLHAILTEIQDQGLEYKD